MPAAGIDARAVNLRRGGRLGLGCYPGEPEARAPLYGLLPRFRLIPIEDVAEQHRCGRNPCIASTSSVPRFRLQPPKCLILLERAKGFEPSTLTLAT